MPRQTKHGKRTVDEVIGYQPTTWAELTKEFSTKLRRFMVHSYSRRIQNYSRKDLLYNVVLPVGWIISFMDFIHDLKIEYAEVPLGASTQL